MEPPLKIDEIYDENDSGNDDHAEQGHQKIAGRILKLEHVWGKVVVHEDTCAHGRQKILVRRRKIKADLLHSDESYH